MAGKQSVLPGTSSRGFAHKTVIITGLTDDDRVVCRDQYGREVIVNANVQRAKGFRPFVGERWFINREFGGWTLAACLSVTKDPVGVPLLRAFDFAYNTPGILTGAALYTPTVGDILLDARIEITTAWDGTTPFGDFGTFTGTFGVLATVGPGGACDMTIPRHGLASNAGLTVMSASSTSLIAQAIAGSLPSGPAPWQATITTAAPIKVCVSTTGQTDGADPGSTQGSAILYLVTATPMRS